MEKDELSDAGYRAQFEYYDSKETTYRRLAEEMYQKKMVALEKLKKQSRVKEDSDGE